MTEEPKPPFSELPEADRELLIMEQVEAFAQMGSNDLRWYVIDTYLSKMGKEEIEERLAMLKEDQS